MPTFAISTHASAVSIHKHTLEELLAAFNKESNASARYAAFAIKADQDGFLKIGSLFRAVSRAERIHAAHHAEILQKLGGVPVATMEEPAVRSTVENLKAAIAYEFYESDVMYPDLIKEAEEQMGAAAHRIFKCVIEAEKEHAWAFTAVLEHIEYCRDEWCQKLSKKAIYFVCPECGLIATRSDFDGCPACGHVKEAFEFIN
jgi:rubrerythrin